MVKLTHDLQQHCSRSASNDSRKASTPRSPSSSSSSSIWCLSSLCPSYTPRSSSSSSNVFPLLTTFNINDNYSQTWANDHLRIATTCLWWLLFWSPNISLYKTNLHLKKDHLSKPATNLESQGGSLYASLTLVLLQFNYFEIVRKMTSREYSFINKMNQVDRCVVWINWWK